MGIELILFGNMASGKTSVGQILKKRCYYEVVSAQEVIKNNLDSADENVKMLRQKGYLLPDDLVIEWVCNCLESAKGKNIILDGFPRTEAQAMSLEQKYDSLGTVVHLDFNVVTLEKRLRNRIICDDCGMPYSKLFTDFNYTCFYCGCQQFSPRPTDRPDYIKVKINQFLGTSLKVIPLLKSFGLNFVSLENYERFADLEKNVLKLAESV